MKLSEIKTGKLLMEYLAEFIVKPANLDAVYNVAMVQKETNNLKEAISTGNASRVTAILIRLNKLGAADRIKKLYLTVKDEIIKARFTRYIS